MSLRSPDEQLRASLGYEFADPGLLEIALTHASAAFERARPWAQTRPAVA